METAEENQDSSQKQEENVPERMISDFETVEAVEEIKEEPPSPPPTDFIFPPAATKLDEQPPLIPSPPLEEPDEKIEEYVTEESTESLKADEQQPVQLGITVNVKDKEPAKEKTPELELKFLHCVHCKATQSWMWKRVSPTSFICTTCDNREDGEEIVPLRRTHRDSVVVHENELKDASEAKATADAVAKSEVVLELESGGASEASSSTPLPTRKSSRSTRSTISNTNPYAYPRPVMSKPKEKKSIAKSAPSYSSPAPVLSLTHQVRYRGTYIKMGDIVSVRGHDGGIYYAQIRGLLEDQYCDKSAALTWLLPTQNSPPPERGFDPDTYIIGMEEDIPRSLDCMEFIMHAPSDYFKIRQPYGFEETYSSEAGAMVS